MLYNEGKGCTISATCPSNHYPVADTVASWSGLPSLPSDIRDGLIVSMIQRCAAIVNFCNFGF